MYTKSIKEAQHERAQRQMKLLDAQSYSWPELLLISVLFVVILSFNGLYA